MRSYDYEHVLYVDTDDTILLWPENYTQPFEGSVKVVCPHDGSVSYHKPHDRHIRFIKKQLSKGVGVVIWSAAGVSWAKAAVKALGLENLDIMVISKPNKILDDLPNPSDILPKIMYLDENKHSS